ncbi:MAG: trypsin-like serine protease [Myxococcaceae bacterium]|nr:trypsin-like serine protease [Myxococcaceae bacterium]
MLRISPRSQAILPVAVPLLLSLLPGCAVSPEAPRSPSAHLEYLVLNGQPDYRNHYASTVQLTANNGTCSGVLVKPQLVLTAAHCFCFPTQLKPGRAYRYTRRNNSSGDELKLTCMEKAEITAMLYSMEEGNEEGNPDGSPNLQGTSRSLRLMGRNGSVRIHEGYEFYTDAAGNVTASKVDLAVVELDKPFDGIVPGGKLATREVQPEEPLTVVGYGLAPEKQWGIRHFGRNNVMDIRISVGDDGLFAFRTRPGNDRAAHAWRGDSGGPCFREDAQGNRWLTGIVSTGQITPTGMVTTFTSGFHHRAWIMRQMGLSSAHTGSR